MRCRQNWSNNCENALNLQIHKEYEASLTYHMLSNYFNRDDVGLDILAEYFSEASKEERTHADNLMNYQNMRGGIVKLGSVSPKNLEFTTSSMKVDDDILQSLLAALDLEKEVNDNLIKLHRIADMEKDPQFCDFLEGNYLNEQVESISKISKYISVIERLGNDQHGIWNYLKTVLG
jgi:ferritin heavy chain